MNLYIAACLPTLLSSLFRTHVAQTTFLHYTTLEAIDNNA